MVTRLSKFFIIGFFFLAAGPILCMEAPDPKSKSEEEIEVPPRLPYFLDRGPENELEEVFVRIYRKRRRVRPFLMIHEIGKEKKAEE